MRSMKIVTVVCWIIAAIALISLAAWFFVGSMTGIGPDGRRFGWSLGAGWENLQGPFEVVGIYNVPADNVDSLRINWVAGEIRVVPHDGGGIIITEYAQRTLNESESLRHSVSEGNLKIEFRQGGSSARAMPQKRLEVLIPPELSAGLDRISAETTSGSINISGVVAVAFDIGSISAAAILEGITAQTLNVSTTSGAIRLTSVTADDIRLSSVSGTVHASDSGAVTLNSSSTSGAINLSGSFRDATLRSVSGRLILESSASNGEIIANTTSGSISVSGSFESANLSSISGAVSISSAVIPASLRASTTSGGVTITVPDYGTITVRHSSTSGRFTSDIPVIMQSSGAQFDLSSTSGSVRILAASA